MAKSPKSAPQPVEQPERGDVTGPRSLTRLLGLFDTLALVPGGMSLAELSVTLASPKTSLLNLLRPLVAEGYLVHGDGSYCLGPSIIRLASRVTSAWNFPKLIRPLMDELVARTGETVLLGMLNRETEVVAFVELVNSPHPVRLQVPAGTIRPLYASPSGWLLLAYADKAFRDQYMASAHFNLKLAAPITRASLARELVKIRAEGMVSSIDTTTVGVGTVAVPVFDGNDECIATLTVAGPSDRIRDDLESIKTAAKEVAAKASGVVATIRSRAP